MPPWKDDIIAALKELDGEADLKNIYEKVAARRTSLPDSWKSSIRKTMQSYNPDSANYYWPNARPIFYNTKDGRWGLRKKLRDGK